MFAFYNLFRKPSSTKLSEIESIIFLGSDETLHISKLVLEQLYLDDSHDLFRLFFSIILLQDLDQ